MRALAACLAFAACRDAELDDGRIGVLTFTPVGRVETTQPIEVRFSAPVVEESAVGKRAGGPCFSFAPPIEGEARWIATDVLQFVPKHAFAESTRYRARVLPSAANVAELAGGVEVVFHTRMFGLLSVESFFEPSGEGVTAKVNVELTHPVAPDAARAAIAFRHRTKGPIPARLDSAAPSSVMAFRLDAAPSPELEITIGAELGAASGGEPIGKAIVRSLDVAEDALRIESIEPIQEGTRLALQIRFTTDVDAAALSKKLDVSPKVELQAEGAQRAQRANAHGRSEAQASWKELQLAEGYHSIIVRGPFAPRQRYTVAIGKGLVSRAGKTLLEAVSSPIDMPDLGAALRFPNEGMVLQRSGSRKLEVETINVEKLELEVVKIYENNLVHAIPLLDAEWLPDLSSMGRSVYTQTIHVDRRPNAPVRTSIAFDDFDTGGRRGLYLVLATDPEQRWVDDHQWVLATDLGITAKVGPEHLRVQVISLSSLEPVAGAEVILLSRTNATLATLKTDPSGVAVVRGSLGDDALRLIAARSGNDFAYLPIGGRTEIPMTDFDVGGAGEVGASYEAYVYTDRGTHRPGDVVRAAVIVRDRSLGTPPPFPFRLELRDPSWRIARTFEGRAPIDGAQAFDVPIARDAPTGTWTLRALAAEEMIGEASIRVEATMPDRIEVSVKPGEASIGKPVPFRVEASYLFGAKASGLSVSAACRFEERRFFDAAHASFTFGGRIDDGTADVFERRELGASALDADGKVDLSCAGDGLATQGPLAVSLVATVSEAGGRAVTRTGGVVLHPKAHYVGLRRGSDALYAEEGLDAKVEAVAVSPKGGAVSGVRVTGAIYEIGYRSILRLVDGRYRYVSHEDATKIGDVAIVTGSDPVAVPFVPPRAGRYRIEVGTPERSEAILELYASGSQSGGWSAALPDRVTMTADRGTFEVGQTAEIMVRAPFSGGRLFLTVERDRVLWQSITDMPSDTLVVKVPVTEAMSPNAFVVAQLVRRLESLEADAPARAIGALPLSVSSARHALSVAIDAPDHARPKTRVPIRITASGSARPVHVTLAAVDEGLLGGGFESPDPFAFFTRHRRLSLTTHDLFGLILPEGAPAKRASGGDAFRDRHLDPYAARRVEPVVLWSGIVEAHAGKAEIELDIPEYGGALRLMAVAFSGDRFGAATGEMKVSDPIVVMPTLPRFIGTLDRITVPIDLINTTDRPEDVVVELAAAGPIRGQKDPTAKVTLGAGERRTVAFELEADEVPGEATVRAIGRSSHGETVQSTILPIRPPGSAVTESATGIARFNKPLSLAIPGGFVPASVRARIEIGPSPAFHYGESLAYLLQYPHGCVEQTTARAFPLLYLEDLGAAVGKDVPVEGTLRDHFVGGGIGRIFSMMDDRGGLSYWPGGSYGHPWATVFAAHFLVEARRAGFSVEAKSLDRLLSHTGGMAVGSSGYRAPIDARTQAYALFVLTLAGRPNAGGLHFLADRILATEENDVPRDNEMRALVAGGLALAGLQARASEVLGQDITATAGGPRSGFFSSVRADALTLAILADTNPNHPSVPVLMDVLANRSSGGRWANTQENAYALLALGKIGRHLGDRKPYWGSVSIDGSVLKKFDGTGPFVLEGGAEWMGKDIQISVTGAGKAFVGFRTTGVRSSALPPPSAHGIEIVRKLHRTDGAAIGPSVRRGDLVVTVLEVHAADAIDNVAVVDVLPAGLEIENPRLIEDPHSLPWLGPATPADFADVRDDRIVFYADLGKAETRRFYYTSRAVTAGRFTHPHAQAEAMYDPSLSAASGGGTLDVTE
jgi:hypothetical protein